MEPVKIINKTGVYKIINKISGKAYYGSTKESFSIRWDNHKYDLNKNIHHCIHLQNAWNKYGACNFEFKIVLLCDPDMCLYYEQSFLDKYWDNCVNCYNIATNASAPMAGRKHTEASKELMRKNHPHLSGKDNPNFGKHHTEGHKKWLSDINKGRKHSNQHREKIWGKGNPMFGKAHTQETRAKISKLRKLNPIDTKGEKNGQAKLTKIQVDEIRIKYATGEYTQKELAKQYNVFRQHISAIINNKRWKI